ncbi:hypothetical protein Tco_1126769 [Tanacetum coccineum]
MSIVQNLSVIDTSNLQTALERTKEKLETCIIKKENDMLFFGIIGTKVLSLEKENEHLNSIYQNLFDSIKQTRALAKLKIDSLQEKLNDTTYGNAKLRAQLHTKFSKQKDEVEVFPKVVVNNDLTKPVTSHSVPKIQESKVVKNDKVIALGIFQINPLKNSRVDNFAPNKHVKASVRTKLITVSQPNAITKKDVNSNISGLSSTGVEITAKTKRPKPRSNTKNDKVLSTSKSSYVNDMNSTNKNQSANVSKTANQKKHKANVKKSKKLGSKERLASPRPNKPRTCLRNLQANSFQILLPFLAGYQNLLMVHRLGLLQAYDQETGAAHQLRLEVYVNSSL